MIAKLLIGSSLITSILINAFIIQKLQIDSYYHACLNIMKERLYSNRSEVDKAKAFEKCSRTKVLIETRSKKKTSKRQII